MRLRVYVLLPVLLLGCSSKKKSAPAEVRAAVDAGVAVAAAAPVKLDPFWDPLGAVVIAHDKPCPPGLETLFGGEGKDLKSSTFVATLRGPNQVKLGEYDQPKGTYPIEVSGTLFCHAPDGKLISVAVGSSPKAYIPGERDIGEHYWQANPLVLQHTVPFSESKPFREKNLLGMDARVVFKVGRTEVHRKMEKVQDDAEAAAERKKYNIPKQGSGPEDFGAGRLIHAQVQGVRVATEQSRKTLVEKR